LNKIQYSAPGNKKIDRKFLLLIQQSQRGRRNQNIYFI